jgi:hypothetical protein
MPSISVPSATRVCSPWLPPVTNEPIGGLARRAWPAPALAPIDAPEPLRQRLLDGLLAACKRKLQRRRSLPPGARPNLRPLDEYTPIKPAALSPEDARRRTTPWLVWLLEAEAGQALRVLLAPSSETASTRWRAALTRQAVLASHLAQIILLYNALEERQGTAPALAALDAALARLEGEGRE